VRVGPADRAPSCTRLVLGSYAYAFTNRCPATRAARLRIAPCRQSWLRNRKKVRQKPNIVA